MASVTAIILTKNEELNLAKQLTPYSCEYQRLNEERYELLKKAASRAYLTDEKEKAEYGGIAFESSAHSSRFSSLFETLKSGKDLDQGKLLRIKD